MQTRRLLTSNLKDSSLENVSHTQGVPWAVLSREQELAFISAVALFGFIVEINGIKENVKILSDVIIDACVDLTELFGVLGRIV